MILPKVGNIYKCYDDGKVSKSRQYEVKIIEIIDFKDAPIDIINLWVFNKDCYPNLFEETRYFIKSISFEVPENPKIEIFAETTADTWFGLGELLKDDFYCDYLNNWWCAGLLDVTNEFTNSLNLK